MLSNSTLGSCSLLNCNLNITTNLGGSSIVYVTWFRKRRSLIRVWLLTAFVSLQNTMTMPVNTNLCFWPQVYLIEDCRSHRLIFLEKVENNNILSYVYVHPSCNKQIYNITIALQYSPYRIGRCPVFPTKKAVQQQSFLFLFRFCYLLSKRFSNFKKS